MNDLGPNRPPASPSSSSNEGPTKDGYAIIGGIIGGFFVLLIFFGATSYYYKVYYEPSRNATRSTLLCRLRRNPSDRRNSHVSESFQLNHLGPDTPMLPEVRIPENIAIIDPGTGEPRPITGADLAGFRPAGGIYAACMDLQMQVHLQLQNHVVVPIIPTLRAPAPAHRQGVRLHREPLVYNGHHERRYADDTTIRLGDDYTVGRVRRPGAYNHRSGESTETLPRYDDPPPEYMSVRSSPPAYSRPNTRGAEDMV